MLMAPTQMMAVSVGQNHDTNTWLSTKIFGNSNENAGGSRRKKKIVGLGKWDFEGN